MDVFITGATGYIGQAVAKAFLTKKYQVYALTRSKEKAKLLKRDGLMPVVGELAHPDSFVEEMKRSDLLVHCAYDVSEKAVQIENHFVDYVLEVFGKYGERKRTFIYTSGVWAAGDTLGVLADEKAAFPPLEIMKWRREIEQKLLAFHYTNLSVIILRPGCVYGGAGGLTKLWFSSAEKGSVEIVGNGNNHWAMVELEDLAEAYVLATEKKDIATPILINIVDDSHDRVLEMALAIAKVCGHPGRIHFISIEDGKNKYGRVTYGLIIDQQIANQKAKESIGWQPKRKHFIADIQKYYDSYNKQAKS